MSERKFNRDQDDTEPVKFKPLYLIVGLCVVVIVVLACLIYIFLNNSDNKNQIDDKSNVNENVEKEEITEPTEYVIPTTACTKNVTISTYNNNVFNSCQTDNVVLNFTDVNMIVDTQKIDKDFTINGIYYNKQKIEIDDYLSNGTFNGISFGSNTTDVGMVFIDANAQKKSGLYIFRDSEIVYSSGASSNTLFALSNPIKYAKYESDSLADIDCKKVTDKTKKVYEEGTINFDGSSYKEVFIKNVLISDICK